jgi:hypothetical protein
MFERLIERAKALGAARARRLAGALAEAADAAAPAGVRAAAGEEGILLSGRDLKRRHALERGVRWLVGRGR